MIIVEKLGAVERRYSDQNVKLCQIETERLWNDAIDKTPCQFTYEETNIPIDEDELEAEELLQILMGGEV